MTERQRNKKIKELEKELGFVLHKQAGFFPVQYYFEREEEIRAELAQLKDKKEKK